MTKAEKQKHPDVNHVSIFPILLVNFIGTLGYSVILPFLVVLILKFGGNEIIYGMMGATYSFFQLIGAPILGKWSDKYGRRKILLLSQVGTFFAWVLFIIALLIPNTHLMNINSAAMGLFTLTVPLIVLFLARALDGLTGGNVSVANAYLADITSEEDRKSNFGKMTASANLGFIFGPAMAGILGETALGEKLPVLAAMMISLAAIFVIAFLMPESNPCIIEKSLDEKQTRKLFGHEHKECYEMVGADRIGFKDVLKIDHIRLIYILYFLIFLAFNFFYVAFPVHAVQSLNWSLLKLGIFFSVLGFILVSVQGPVLSKISTRFSDATLTIAGSILLAVSFFLFMSNNEYFIWMSTIFFAAGNGIMWPSFLSILSKSRWPQIPGRSSGVCEQYG